jgi:hypothetical protein
MSDSRPARTASRPDAPSERPSLTELVEVAVRRIATSIFVSGALIALAIYWQADPPRYQVTAADGRIFRVNTESGTVIACENQRCAIVLERGQDLDERLPDRAAPVEASRPAPALPAPTALPTNEAAAANPGGR